MPEGLAPKIALLFILLLYHRVIFRGSVFPEIRKGTGRI